MRVTHVYLALGAIALLFLLASVAGWWDVGATGPDGLSGPEQEQSASELAPDKLPVASAVEEEPVAESSEREPPQRVPVPAAVPEPALQEVTDPALEADEPERLEIAGNISGRLISDKGFWLDSELPEPDTLIVELVRLQEPHLEQRAELRVVETERGKSLHFEFEDVPVGDYELSLFALGAFHWEPKSVRVRAPAVGLDFVRFDREQALPLVFDVYDALTGDAIVEFSSAHLEQTVSETSGVFMHAGPFEGQAFPLASSFHWSVWADGYRASFGDETTFELRDGKRVARVELRAGWSARIVVLGREPTLRPLYRARVEIDGVFAGVTDQDGALVVKRNAEPETIAVIYKGWELENDPFDPRPGSTAELRGFVLPLILRDPE